MTASGYVKIHRQVQAHALWTSERFSRGQAWIDLLLQANYHDSKILRSGQWIEIRRGQVFTSQKELSRRWRWDRKTVKCFLLTLKTDNMVDIQTAKQTDTGYTLLTITNYKYFQGSNEEPLDIQRDIVLPIDVSKSPHPNGHPTGHPNGQDSSLESQRVRGSNQAPVGHPKGHPTTHSLPTSKKNKKVNKKPSVFWSDFLRRFATEDQQTLSNVLMAISSTRKSGKIAEGIQDALAVKFSQYPQGAVLAGCRTYMQKNYAAEGKDEKYLIGIVRQLSKNGFHENQPAKTQGQAAIDAAARELLEVQR